MIAPSRRPQAIAVKALPTAEHAASRFGLCAVLALGLTGCPATPAPSEGAAAAIGEAPAMHEANPLDPSRAEAVGTGGPSAGALDAPNAGAAAAAGAGDSASDAAAGSGAAPAATGGADDVAEETGGSGGESAGAVDEITPLLDEAKKKRTSDEKATALLDDAKTKGAAPSDVAKTANARGLTLMGEPDRAKAFFEYAMAADEKYPDAPFNLAKIAANEGDLDRVKELLAEVKARGGKKLLKTVGFDPTFALVAGEPDVEKLLK